MSVLRLKEALEVCSRSFETADVADSDAAVAGVVGHLASVAESPPPDAEDVLLEIDRFLSSPDSNQMVVDTLSLELPEVIIKFVLLSDKCREVAESILDRLVSVGSPREMLSIFCEVLDTHINVYKGAICYTLLLRGLSKVFLCIQRRHVEQVKVALPLILKAIAAVYSESDEEDIDSFNNFFGVVISIGTSIKEICQKLEGRRKNELRAILGLYVLHNIALISKNTESHMVSSCSSLVLQLSQFLPFCGFTYYDLLTSFDFGTIAGEQPEVDGDDFMSCFSFSMDGASLAVIWGHISEEVAKAAGEHAMATLNKIRDDRHGRWKALGSLKSILPLVDYLWVVKSHSIDLILSMTDGTNPVESDEVPIDFSSLMPSIFAVLKGIQRTMIGAPDASLRKKAFLALKKDEGQQSLMMSNKDGKNYMCFLPIVAETKLVKPITQQNSSVIIVETNNRIKLKIPDELLDVLKDKCLYRHEGWWSYELCYLKYLYQLHLEEYKALQELYLGMFDSEATAAFKQNHSDDSLLKDPRSKDASQSFQIKNNTSFYFISLYMAKVYLNCLLMLGKHDLLLTCIKEYLGFEDEMLIAACIIYWCLLD